MKKTFLIIILIIYSLNIALAQAPAIDWQNTIGGSYFDAVTSIQQTTDGGYIIGGRAHTVTMIMMRTMLKIMEGYIIGMLLMIQESLLQKDGIFQAMKSGNNWNGVLV